MFKYNSYYKKSRFKKLIRITPRQLKWIKNNKKEKTSAGFLEKIIAYYKKNI
jgi:ribosomal protein L24E